ncbi:LTA synthase family protein [Herbivorax sp. ANBcel31]|uniref:LTA synthase family protein n=1 Tax=Herbivorax sp. ANBcel31 TaxID=3069754 RepID=UPI0027B8144F|nr:LTA synthase family protein [Herbivorax sp. ANBcel31]MDQ2086441.1 LTA synthase family protein [Herbivorax sp. ANBcel31]
MLKSIETIKKNPHYGETLYWVLFIFAVLMKCIYFQFATQLNSRPYLSFTNLMMMLSSFAIILIISALVALVFNRKRILALFIVNFLLTVLLIADTNFFRYYYDLISIPVFNNLDSRIMNTVNQSVPSLLNLKDIVFIADLPIMFAGLIILNKRVEKIKFRKRALRSLTLLTIGLVTFLTVYPKAEVTTFAYSNNYSTQNLGVFYSHFYSTKSFIRENIFRCGDLEEDKKNMIKDMFKDKNKSRTGDRYFGVAEDKNLIIVQMESIQSFVIGESINGEEITPNLNRLIDDSLYFDNIYYQTAGGNTSDAEFLFNTSLYPVEEGAVYYRFYENTYHSLPLTLKDKGYDTYSLHGFDKDFWNRNEMYEAIGFDNFFSAKDYEMDEFAGWQGDALSDLSFFRQSIDKIDTSNPFYGFFVTLSCHHPYDYFEDFEYDVGELEGTYLGNYIKAANYADECIGYFIEELKKRDLYNDSLLVLYGDHKAIPKVHADKLFEFLEIEDREDNWAKIQKVPLVMRYPDQETSEILSGIGGQIDILPTISNMMGFDFPYALGKDLLNTDEQYAIFRNGSIITNDYVYINCSRNVYDYKDGNLLDIEPYEEEISSYLKELEVSDIIITKDVFKGTDLVIDKK